MKQLPNDRETTATPGLVIAALRGGSGKTILSVGIIAALRRRHKTIAPFKKGPDYIDAGWLALAAGRPCCNLDTFLIEKDTILDAFQRTAQRADMALVEGNRGLYDSIDREGSTSTAELAKWLGLPVVLCLDATKTTRTMAAVVKGCMAFDTAVDLRGVVLNRVAGSRHQQNLRRCIEHYCQIPVLGAIPKLKTTYFPERHMGLVPTPEHDWATVAVDAMADVMSRYLDLDALLQVAETNRRPTSAASSHESGAGQRPETPPAVIDFSRVEQATPAPRIGIVRDSAFQFYYPENIEALKSAGATIVFTSPLTDRTLPEVDALYIGGGFPETHARQLSQNRAYRQRIKALAHKGLPVYAECGGLMYLGESLRLSGSEYEMAGVLPLRFGFGKKPRGHGYTILTVTAENPYFAPGTQIKGHEFHYSRVIDYRGQPSDLVFQVQRGSGLVDKQDGICVKNVLATYTHIHALGMPFWAGALVKQAVLYRQTRK